MTEAILVTGGAGYIGAHVCKALSAAGYLPVVLDDLSTGHRNFIKWGPLWAASIADSEAVKSLIRTYEIKAVIDLAASSDIAESMRNPLKFYANNVSAKQIFLETLQASKIEAIVFSSTASVYGEPDTVPITEAHRLQPQNTYGWTKLMGEQMLHDLHAAGGPRWIALRYFNAAGASFDGDIGEAHEPETHLIARACLVALGLAPQLEIYGNDYPTSDGTAIRDFVHVEDLAMAHVAALSALRRGLPAGAYNLGNNYGFSVQEIANCFGTIGYPVPHCFKPRRAGDPAQLIADATKAQQILGWKPRYSEIKTIISSAYAWHRQITSKYQNKTTFL